MFEKALNGITCSCHSGPGVKAGGPNKCDEILASGDYTVLLDFGASGSRRERVTIRPREVTELRVRL